MSTVSPEPIVLASASTVRARLLGAAGVAVTVDHARLDEDEIKAAYRHEGRTAADCAAALAEAKAKRVALRHPDDLVIGADQILSCEDTWFDKPGSRDAARAQLLALRGKRHTLSAAAVVVRGGQVMWHHVEEPHLLMRRFSDEFLDAYLTAAGEAVLSSVGAYQLEGLGAQLFARIEGDYFSILGLPLLPLLDCLRGHGALAA